MRPLVLWNLVTLDGLFEGTKAWDLAFHQLAWGEELERLSIEQLEAADLLVFGRATGDGMAAYWRTATGQVADFMNRLPKVVFSRAPRAVDWANTTVLREDPAAAVARLKREGDGAMFVFGSADLSQTLMDAGAFDEVRLAIVPVILGAGRPLFPRGLRRRAFTLLESRRLSNGCLVVRYAASGSAAAG